MSRPLRTTITLTMLAGALLLPACAQYRVIRPSDDPTAGGPHRETINALFWGTVYEPVAVATQCRYGINDVTIHSNFLYDLISVVTLGIWMPIEVEYTCVEPQPQEGEIPFDPELFEDDDESHDDADDDQPDHDDSAGQ